MPTTVIRYGFPFLIAPRRLPAWKPYSQSCGGGWRGKVGALGGGGGGGTDDPTAATEDSF